MSENPFFQRAYQLGSTQATQKLYADWAESYDQTLSSHGYITPARCAAALTRHESDKGVAILDIGCGTGISGLALAEAGFTNVHGTDLSAEMVEKARKHVGLYRSLACVSAEDAFDFEPGTYRHITAMGVIAAMHAPPETIDRLLDKLMPGGLLIFSLNNHTLSIPAFPAARDAAIASGRANLLEGEFGPHITELNMSSQIVVLQRTST